MNVVMHELAADQLALVAHNARVIREQAKLSQAAVARRGGTSQRTVSNLEQRVGSPTLANLVAVAHGLNIPPYVLFFPGADDPKLRGKLVRLYHAYTSTDSRGRAAIELVAEQQSVYGD